MDLLITHQTQFVQIYSLIHRRTDTTFLMKSLQNLIVSLRKTIMTEKSPSIQQSHFTILKLLFKLIVYTRDIGGGLGERNIAYCMLFIWKYHFLLPTAYCLHQIVSEGYGSWRDIKGFCDFIRKHSEKGEQDPFIETCIGLMNHQLDIDCKTHRLNQPISLGCRWIPRETSAYKWLFERCSLQWIRAFRPQYLKSAAGNNSSLDKAIKKGKKEYRLICSSLSKYSDTLQIKQCANQWDTINPNRIPMNAMTKQQNALLNIGLNGTIRTKTSLSTDRNSCAMKIQSWWMVHKSKRPIYIEMGTVIKQAFRSTYRTECLWSSILSKIPNTSHMFPLLDMSLFHTDPESFYHALGMALAIACRSTERKLLVFDKTAHLVTLSGNLSQMLDLLKPIYHEHHIGSDLKNAIAQVPSSSLLLVVFSNSRHHDENILYWGASPTKNVGCTNIFVGCTNNTIARIAELKPDTWKLITPYIFVQYLLSNKRYDQIDAYFDTILK